MGKSFILEQTKAGYIHIYTIGDRAWSYVRSAVAL